MKTSLLFSLAVGLIVPVSAFAQFSDTEGYRYEAAIDFVNQEQIAVGYGDGTFRPNALINRAEFTKIMVESANIEVETCTEMPFWDVQTNVWYSPYVCTAKKYGIISGYPDGSFQPNANVNFAEAAKITAESMNLPMASTSGPWYEMYVNAVVDAGVDFSPSLRPAELVTRGEMAYMIYIGLNGDGRMAENCVPAGCSGTLCVPESEADDTVTTCEWRPEYACYNQDYANCERQSTGECGWTPNEEFNRCLAQDGPEQNDEENLTMTETEIRIDGEVVLTISDFSDEIEVSSGAVFGSSDYFTNAALSADGEWIAVGVSGAAHGFGWIYNRDDSDLRPVIFQYGGSIESVTWLDSEVAEFSVTTPEPSTETVEINVNAMPEYPRISDQ